MVAVILRIVWSYVVFASQFYSANLTMKLSNFENENELLLRLFIFLLAIGIALLMEGVSELKSKKYDSSKSQKPINYQYVTGNIGTATIRSTGYGELSNSFDKERTEKIGKIVIVVVFALFMLYMWIRYRLLY